MNKSVPYRAGVHLLFLGLRVLEDLTKPRPNNDLEKKKEGTTFLRDCPSRDEGKV